jgi:hypothetical protein
MLVYQRVLPMEQTCFAKSILLETYIHEAD